MGVTHVVCRDSVCDVGMQDVFIGEPLSWLSRALVDDACLQITCTFDGEKGLGRPRGLSFSSSVLLLSSWRSSFVGRRVFGGMS